MTGGFKDKVVLVTGAASGIGRSICLRLAREGSDILLADIDQAGLESASREIESTGARASWYLADVSDAAQVEKLHERVMSEHGAPDILVNSAGVAMSGTMDEVSLDDWRWLLGVNLWGIIHTVHYFVGDMYERGSGHIVNLASAAGLFALPHAGLYTTSKHAVVGLSAVLRAEASVHGVSVTAVCPGFVRTPMLDNVKTVEPVKAAGDTEAAKRIAMSAEKLAERIVAGILKDKPVLTCPLYVKIMHGASTFFPRLWDRWMKVSARAGYKARQAKR